MAVEDTLVRGALSSEHVKFPAMRPQRIIKSTRYRLTHKPVLHFLHLPKTGGTAIRAALEGHEFEGRYALKLHRGRRHLLTFPEIPPGERVFFAIRDPVDRFVSAFYSRLRRGQPRYDVPWTPGEELVFKRFSSASQLAEALDSDDPEAKDAAVAGMGAVRHFARYSHWLGPMENFRARLSDVVTVLHTESLTADFGEARTILGVTATLPHDDIGAHRNPVRVDRSLSVRATTNLRTWYAQDFDYIDVSNRVDVRSGQHREHGPRVGGDRGDEHGT
ncbi:MAG: sulfotransferase family 2 domain-containing protein [Nocardioidaceae bacterium]